MMLSDFAAGVVIGVAAVGFLGIGIRWATEEAMSLWTPFALLSMFLTMEVLF